MSETSPRSASFWRPRVLPAVLVIIVPLLLASMAVADDAVLQALVGDLGSDAVAVRCQAASRLGQLGDRRAAVALITSLADAEPQVRRQAAQSLGMIKDRRATAALVTALQDADQNVRFYAAYALGEIKDAAATEALLKALADPAWPVRDQAAWALKEIGGEAVAQSLIARLAAPDESLQQLAWILKNLQRDTTLEALREAIGHASDRTRQRVLIVMAALQDARLTPDLVQALDDPSPRVRHRAVQLLALLRDRSLLERLMRVAKDDEDKAVRDTAQEAVESLSRTNQLLAYWSFDTLQPLVAPDETNNGNDGQVNGCESVPGKRGRALQFGPGQFVEIGRPGGFPVANAPFTVTAWVKAQAAEGVVVARGGAACGFSLYVKEGVPKFGIHRLQDGPGYIAAGTSLKLDQWVHLAGVVHPRRIELYVDGSLAGSAETAGYLPSECGQGMEIGLDVGNSAAEIVSPFRGLIDEVKVYGAALSAAEIRAESKK